MKYERITLLVEEDLLDVIDEAARKTERSRNAFIRWALKKVLRELGFEVGDYVPDSEKTGKSE